MPGRLSVVATPIGNLEDITLRALRVLREVDLIAAEDTRWTAKLLGHHGITTRTTSFHEHNEAMRAPRLVEALMAGRHLALVSDAGSPGVSDPGARLVRAVLEAGGTVEPVPGPSAVIAALSVSGLSGGAFRFLGFPPVKGQVRRDWLERVRGAVEPVVCFEAPHRVRRLLDDLMTVLEPSRRVVVCREMTKLHEELVEGPIDSVGRMPITTRGELTLVIDAGAGSPQPDLAGDRLGAFRDIVGVLTDSGWTRRAVVVAMARVSGLPRRATYDLVEQFVQERREQGEGG